jgi:phosphodiesterase/alkaline phosphatase D-like protein
MAVTHWYTGRSGPTSATVVVRADATGNVPVSAAGVTLQAACDTSVNDGNALVEFTGLQPGQRIPYTVGGVAGGTLRTHHVSGPMWLAVSSCWNISRVDLLALRLLQPPTVGASATLMQEAFERMVAFIGAGDLVYMNMSGTTNGYAMTLVDGGSLANAKDINVRRQYYRAGRQHAGLRELMRSVPTLLAIDDHEHDPDNACYDVAWAQAKFGGGTTQGDLDDVWAAARGAWREWTLGNPDKPALGGVLGGPDCYSMRIGNLDVWVSDLILERTYHSTADGPAKRMASAVQEEWLLSDMAASTAPLKLWVSTKQFISSCGRNADGWYNLPGAGSEGYQTQLQRVLADPRFPRSGALSVTGDEHIKSDIWVEPGRFGGDHAGISQLSAGPATIEVITNPDDGLAYADGVRYKERDTSGITSGGYSARGENAYALLRLLDDRVERYMLGSRYGLRYMGYVGLHDNQVRR